MTRLRLLVAAATLAMLPLAAQADDGLSAETLLPPSGEADAYQPSAAFGDGVYLVAWQAGRNRDGDIVAARVDAFGKVLDAKPIVVCSAKDDQSRPRVAFGGGNFLVTWQDLRGGADYDVYAARVSPEGKLLDPDGIAVSTEKGNQCQQAVCFDGEAFRLLWRDFRKGGGYDVFGGRVSAEGRALDGGGTLVQERLAGTYQTLIGVPTVAANAKRELLGAVFVSWSRYGKVGVFKIVNGKSANRPNLIATATSFEPALASDGENFLLTFTTYHPKSRAGVATKSGAALYGPDAAPLVATIALSATGSPVRNPSPAWDGRTYVVAWDMPQAAAPRGGYIYDAVLLRRIAKDGKGEDADTPVAGEMESPALHPAAASDGKGATLIAYERHPKTADAPIRIGLRLLKAN